MGPALGTRIRRILCPTDFSSFSASALDLAVDLARAQDAEVLMIHVEALHGPAQGSGACRTPMAFAAEDPQQELARAVGAARERGVRAEGVVLEGDAVERILERAETWPADLLVMGTHGQSEGHGWDLGSVTERVLRSAPCPVLITTRAEERHGAPARAAFQSILCPSDFSAVSRRAFDSALLLARAFEARITLLHVLEWFPGRGDDAHVHVPEYHMDLSQEARDAMWRAVPEDARPWCSGEVVVSLGQPHREILRVARERGVDLIVLGVHGQRALDRTLSGATVSHVVRETPCPVLAVRAAAEPVEAAPLVTRRAS